MPPPRRSIPPSGRRTLVRALGTPRGAPPAGAVLIGATGSWVKSVYGYAEGQGGALAATPDWRQTARAVSGCESVLATNEALAGLIVTARAQAAGFCGQVLAIPDATVVLADHAQASGSATAAGAPELVIWPELLVCEQQALATAVPETVLDAEIVLVETPSLLAGDFRYAIAMVEASLPGWSLALGASDPIERWAQAQADGANVAGYREPPVLAEPLPIAGFADVVAHACSSDWGEARSWASSGAEAVIAACWQDAEGVARGDAFVRGVGGFPFTATTRRTRGNCAVWARASNAA